MLGYLRQGNQKVPDRKRVMLTAAGLAIVFIWLLTIIIPVDTRIAEIVLDHSKYSRFPYPFTMQNFEHILFFIGMGELYVRWRAGEHELSFSRMGLLPEDQTSVLQTKDLAPIHRQVATLFDNEYGILPSLVDRCILQFQSGRSIDQTVAVMTSSLELMEHRVDLRYGLVRFLAWMIPTIGFIGTVIGLGGSLALVPKNGDIDIYTIAQALSLGFNTTMVALIESAILVFTLQFVQEKEETAVNIAGTYVLRNLINRLYEGPR